ncbi:MAG: AAA family ATPase [Scytonematopsis contorta HA4267-MV1]|jgi:hypothetical protein|nr:AAA family ATPase [Scytonematopsis contorta HA4267-MV1]
MSWLIPYNKLDAEQRDAINLILANSNRNFFIQGFAGSGKSILLLYILILAKKQNPNLRICVVGYTKSLVDMFNASIPDELKSFSHGKSYNPKGIDVKTFSYFEKKPSDYDLILVDEVQDLSANTLLLLKSKCRQMIVAGDGAQSIYEVGLPAINIVELINAVVIELKILHRLPNKIIEITKSVFPGRSLEKANRSKLRNVDAILAFANDMEHEISYVWENASNYAASRVNTAILLPNNKSILYFVDSVCRVCNKIPWSGKTNEYGEDFDNLNKYLEFCGLRMQYLGKGYGNLSDSSLVNIMTYHSGKGLDFETVFLPNLNDRTSIWRGGSNIADNLFYVALTRTRLNLYLSYTGNPHEYVKRIPNNLLRLLELPIKKQEPVGDNLGNDDSEEYFF